MVCCLENSDRDEKHYKHLIKYHIHKQTQELDLSQYKFLTSESLDILATNENACGIRRFDFSGTRIGYGGIVKLWNSLIIESHIWHNSPTYERSTGVPLSTIEVEISNTRAYAQYQKGKFLYSLPLLDGLEITYNGLGKSYSYYGYKKIKLLCYGKELDRTR